MELRVAPFLGQQHVCSIADMGDPDRIVWPSLSVTSSVFLSSVKMVQTVVHALFRSLTRLQQAEIVPTTKRELHGMYKSVM